MSRLEIGNDDGFFIEECDRIVQNNPTNNNNSANTGKNKQYNTNGFTLLYYVIMIEKIHIGNIIKLKLKEKERSITWLSKQIGYTRSSIGKMLKQEHIHCILLLRISNVLEYDFFAHYSVLLSNNSK